MTCKQLSWSRTITCTAEQGCSSRGASAALACSPRSPACSRRVKQSDSSIALRGDGGALNAGHHHELPLSFCCASASLSSPWAPPGRQQAPGRGWELPELRCQQQEAGRDGVPAGTGRFTPVCAACVSAALPSCFCPASAPEICLEAEQCSLQLRQFANQSSVRPSVTAANAALVLAASHLSPGLGFEVTAAVRGLEFLMEIMTKLATPQEK